MGPAASTTYHTGPAGTFRQAPSQAPSAAVRPLLNGSVLAEYRPAGSLVNGIDWSSAGRAARGRAGNVRGRAADLRLPLHAVFFRTQLANASVYGVQLQPGVYTVRSQLPRTPETPTGRPTLGHVQVNSTLDGFAFNHDCTGLARPFEVSFAGSNLTFLNGNIGYMRAHRACQLGGLLRAAAG